MFDTPKAEVCPSWSCQKSGVAERTRLCQAYGTRRSGARIAGHGRMTRPAFAQPAAMTAAVGAMKMIDS